MKSLLVLVTLLLSAQSWAGGPDIPWPEIDPGHSEDSSDNDEDKSDSSEGAPKPQLGYTVYIEKNQSSSSKECPFLIIFEKIDLTTGEVIGEHEVLHCNGQLQKLSPK